MTLRSLYICYLTLEDPLVHTQVLAYLEGLVSHGHTVHLLTFEHRMEPSRRRSIEAELRGRGITWHTLRYHKRPTLPATIYDALAGAVYGTWLTLRYRLGAVHARGHVPAAPAVLISRLTRRRFIFDIRSLLAEEYVEAGRWRRDGLPYRIADRMQSAAIRRADGIVVLTQRAREYLFGSSAPETVHVIPCCADLEALEAQREARAAVRSELGIGDRPVLLYVGKFTGRYLDREMVEFFARARLVQPGLFFLVLTQTERSAVVQQFERAGLSPADYHVTRVPAEQVGGYLAAADFGICLLIQSAIADVATSPTKVGEYLGAGLPLVVSAGMGDVDALLREHEIGVVVQSFTAHGYEACARQVAQLMADSECSGRCRKLARDHYSLREVGIPRYDRLYRQVAALAA